VRITPINLGGIRAVEAPGSFVKIFCARRVIHPLSGAAREKKAASKKN
jgi:hypothetical protein